MARVHEAAAAAKRELEAERAEHKRIAAREQEEWAARRQGEERALREAVRAPRW